MPPTISPDESLEEQAAKVPAVTIVAKATESERRICTPRDECGLIGFALPRYISLRLPSERRAESSCFNGRDRTVDLPIFNRTLAGKPLMARGLSVDQANVGCELMRLGR